MGGLGGRITGTPFLRKGWALSRQQRPKAAAGRARQAVPVATKEATGIDSRDEGFPFPPNNL